MGGAGVAGRGGGGRSRVRPGRGTLARPAAAAALLRRPDPGDGQPDHGAAERGAVDLVPAVHLLLAGPVGRRPAGLGPDDAAPRGLAPGVLRARAAPAEPLGSTRVRA